MNKIIEKLDELATKYNATEPDPETVKQEIEALALLVQIETKTIKTNTEKTLIEFEDCLEIENNKFKPIMEQYYNEFVELLKD